LHNFSFSNKFFFEEKYRIFWNIPFIEMKNEKLLIIQQTCAEAAKALQYPMPTQGIEE
jgi:hypothetical protein